MNSCSNEQAIVVEPGSTHSESEIAIPESGIPTRKEKRKMATNRTDEDLLFDLADLFRMFADSTRVRILYALMDGEVPVTELANTLNMTASAISHQLRLLKDAKLVGARRDGKAILYSLADDHVRTILSMGMEHLNE